MNKYIVLIFLIAMCNSCELVIFDKPQPDNVNPIKSFPLELQGKYLSKDQESILTIADKLITRHYKYDAEENKDSIDSSYKLIGDTLINLIDSTKEKITIEGDKVIQHADWTDTLFIISAYGVLKEFKDYYFINNCYNENAWEVKRLSLKKGLLTFGSISSEADIKKLRAITKASSDTSTYFTLTRKQFKKFIRQNGFDEQEIFYRIKEQTSQPQQCFF